MNGNLFVALLSLKLRIYNEGNILARKEQELDKARDCAILYFTMELRELVLNYTHDLLKRLGFQVWTADHFILDEFLWSKLDRNPHIQQARKWPKCKQEIREMYFSCFCFENV